MQITRDNYSQYANMVQQMFGNKKNSNNPLAQCDYGNFALRFKSVDIQFTKPNWDNIMTNYNDELARLKKVYGENAKGTVSYQQIQSDLAAGTKAPSSGRTLDIQI